MAREITKRETLLECLELMKKFRNAFSKDQYGMMAIERYTALYEEYDAKCWILREMIQALESEPVRRAMADWQKMVMENGPEALKLDGPAVELVYDPGILEEYRREQEAKHGNE